MRLSNRILLSLMILSATCSAQPGLWLPAPISAASDMHLALNVLEENGTATKADVGATSIKQTHVFNVVQAPGGQVDLNTLGETATLQVAYPTMGAGDTVGAKLTGVQIHNTGIKTVSSVGVQSFLLPKAWFVENANRSVTLTYTYKVGGAGNLITSAPLSLRVVAAPGTSTFQVVGAVKGELDLDKLGGTATLQVSYPTMGAGDTVGAKLTGVQIHNTGINTVSSVGVQSFLLPKAWFVENANRSVTLTYTYKVGGVGNLITSAPLSLRVVAAPGASTFQLVGAVKGEVDLAGLGETATLQVYYPTISTGDTVGAKLTGVQMRNTSIKTVSTVGVQSFSLPKAWFIENTNRSITLTYTYKVGGTGNLITSSPLTLYVRIKSSSGQQVVAELNAQYADKSNTCAGNKAAIYCNGVIIRTVDDNPAFHAWNPSPSAVSLGGVSFSYMRQDLDMNRLQAARTQGFILSTADQFTQNGGYAPQVLCAFPYDAGTAGRRDNGCGDFSGLSGSGPCLSQGINSLAKWRVHFNQLPVSTINRYRHQCSFAPDAASFALSMLARENPGAELEAWRQNEVVIKLWPQNTNNLPIKAFFYWATKTRAVGLIGAQNIQRDFFNQTGRVIPIIRVTPNVTVGDVFSYQQGDQAL
jgi:hypothetical protein